MAKHEQNVRQPPVRALPLIGPLIGMKRCTLNQFRNPTDLTIRPTRLVNLFSSRENKIMKLNVLFLVWGLGFAGFFIMLVSQGAQETITHPPTKCEEIFQEA